MDTEIFEPGGHYQGIIHISYYELEKIFGSPTWREARNAYWHVYTAYGIASISNWVPIIGDCEFDLPIEKISRWHLRTKEEKIPDVIMSRINSGEN